MKNCSFFAAVLIGCLVISCNGDKPMSDRDTAITKKEPCLEDILQIENEQELKNKYGADNVFYDTIWGAEGYFSMGTVVRTDSVSRVEIYWKNDSLRQGLVSATLVSESDWYGPTVPAGKWKSCTGVELGMSLEEVEKINGRPFTFSGFGWDYAGGIISWEEGTLDGKGMTLQVSEGQVEIPPAEYEQILGDQPVSSNNPIARKSGARVWSISVAKVN